MIAAGSFEVRRRLADPALPGRLADLGFRDRDASDLQNAITEVLKREDQLDSIGLHAGRLVERIGHFGPSAGQGVWSGLPGRTETLGAGVLPMLAFVATAPEVASFHAGRGIPPDVTAATLADLGQQVWVHRLTYQEFGLHTYGWLTLAWSGALYWLGRLQFNLHLDGGPGARGEWVLSTHIPRTGPLTPESVDASLATAREFFAAYFPDYPTRDFFCESWLLDPELAVLLPQSNLATFQRRWTLHGEPKPGDDDTFFFVFNRRPPVDVTSLPTDTALRRATAARLAAGQSWSIRRGRLPQWPGKS